MSDEAVLALVYAGFLLAMAEGVRRFVHRKAARELDALRESTYDPELPWPHSEALQLRRAVVAVMPGVATILLIAALARNHAPLEAATLGTLLIVSGAVTLRAVRSVRGTYIQRSPLH